MPDKHVFEYAVIRVVPRVDRGEYINTGVMVFCKRKRFLQLKYEVNEARLAALWPDLDVQEVHQYLKAWDLISQGSKEGGPIAQLDVPDRFRWLSAVKSTILQSSRIHPGLTDNPEEMLDQLFRKYVDVTTDQAQTGDLT